LTDDLWYNPKRNGLTKFYVCMKTPEPLNSIGIHEAEGGISSRI